MLETVPQVVRSKSGQQLFHGGQSELNSRVTVRVHHDLPAVPQAGRDGTAQSLGCPVGVATVVFAQVGLQEVTGSALVRSVGDDLPRVGPNHLVTGEGRDAGLFPRCRYLVGGLARHDGELGRRHAHWQALSAVHLVQHGQLGNAGKCARGRLTKRRDALACALIEDFSNSRSEIRLRWLGQFARKNHHCWSFANDARELAIGTTEVSSGRVHCLVGHICGRHGGTVHVEVVHRRVHDHHRIVRRHLVENRTRQIWFAGVEAGVKEFAEYPLAVGRLGCGCFDRGHHRIEGRARLVRDIGPREVQQRRPHVHVGFNETRNHDALGLHRCGGGVGQALDIRERPDANDLSARDGHGLSRGSGRIARGDRAHNESVGLF
ncbi:unannotated protein [freshwater metagenome]|uniref:Unannotated protein n=1 Tax=freshwater metagenome TaxID=449393 RepID=A0A6J7GD47_9ZZZZ